MAEYCINCKKKLGFLEVADLYVTDEKPICNKCAQPIAECFEELYNCNAKELIRVEKELTEICKNTYDDELSKLIIQKFNEQRTKMGL